jgi:16S rRNA processing protein RimM
MGAEIAVEREQLPETGPEEYYWTDLEGLSVVCQDGTELGRIDHLMETGANDVLVVIGERERLIPYIPGQVIKSVDLENGRMVVDWDPEF